MDTEVFRWIARNSRLQPDVLLRMFRRQFPTIEVQVAADLERITESAAYRDMTLLISVCTDGDDIRFTACRGGEKVHLPLEDALPLLDQDEASAIDFRRAITELSPQRQTYYVQACEKIAKEEEAFCSYSQNPGQSSIIQQQENDIDASHIPPELGETEMQSRRAQLPLIRHAGDSAAASAVIGAVPLITCDQLKVQLTMRSGAQQIVDIRRIAQSSQLSEKVVGFLASALLLQDKE